MLLHRSITTLQRTIKRFEAGLDLTLGTIVCGWAALLLAIVYFGERPPALLPLMFIAVVACVTRWVGRVAGMVGCATAALIFAFFLYPPVGSLAIAERTARTQLAWMILVGFCVARLLFPGVPQHKRK